MARADLLLKLVRSGTRGDPGEFRRIVEAVIAEERAKAHNVLAGRLEEALHNGSLARGVGPSAKPADTESLLAEVAPRHALGDLVLPDSVREQCEEVVEEQHRAELLRSFGLEPRHRLLFTGPPGNGKTSLAEAMADAMMYPFLVARYEGLIGSFLGDTAGRLSRLFDHVRTRRCVLFLDEFDTVGKERGDEHETGEIKRVVSSLLLQIDDIPSHVVVITATNHPELLDRAAWRRFQVRLSLPLPAPGDIRRWMARFEQTVGEPLGVSAETVARKLAGLSFAELEQFCVDVLRRKVLEIPDADVKRIIRERLQHWSTRANPTRGE